MAGTAGTSPLVPMATTRRRAHRQDQLPSSARSRSGTGESSNLDDRTGHLQHQGRPAAAAKMGATGRQRNSTSTARFRPPPGRAGWMSKPGRKRRNAVKVLPFDVGGSMDPYVKVMEELFSAACAEFKHPILFIYNRLAKVCGATMPAAGTRRPPLGTSCAAMEATTRRSRRCGDVALRNPASWRRQRTPGTRVRPGLATACLRPSAEPTVDQPGG